MKKIFFAFMMVFALTNTPTFFAQTGQAVTFKITNVPTKQGKVLLATSDGKYCGMSEVTDSTPEVKLEGIPNGKYTIHIFHDSNGNYVLDRDANDIPIEYCATREIEITDEYKTFQIQLFNIKDKIDNK